MSATTASVRVPTRLRASLWREGDVAIFDFEGTDPQAKSSINFYLNEDMFKMFFGSFTINLFDPHILFNDGFYELVDVRIPDGSLLEAEVPGGTVGSHARAGPHLRRHGRRARPGRAGCDERGRLLRQPAPVLLRLRRRTASGSSCSRSASAAFRAVRSATVPTVTRCGRASPTCRTSSSRPTSRCASSSTSRSPTRAVPVCTVAATACRLPTSSLSTAISAFTTSAG